MTDFTVFPAIDMRAGKVVRLEQGDPSRQTNFGDDPKAWAQLWKDEGAAWLHVINLSGAFDEDSAPNLDALEDILEIGLNIEYGGGIRDEESLRIPLEMGVRRVYLGTAAVQTPSLVDWAIDRFGPARIAVDIGISDKKVMVKGWQEPTQLSALEMGKNIRKRGVEWCVLTNVKRDGVSEGVDFSSAIKLQQRSGLNVVVSGGVSSSNDISRARKEGLAGIIVGRALYAGEISLKDALAASVLEGGPFNLATGSRNDHDR